jgi:putative transposase
VLFKTAFHTLHVSRWLDVTDILIVAAYAFVMNLDRVFFVTTVCWQRMSFFKDVRKAELMMEVLEHYQREKKYVLHEFVIMPDHLHLLIEPAEDLSLERAVQLIKGGFSYRVGKLETKRGLVWQESFTNHRIRDEEDYEGHVTYVRMNPVKAGLVERAEDYPYSSVRLRLKNSA